MRIELYKILIDESSDGTAYHYTSSDTAFDHDGDTYEPAAIGRGDMVQGNEINRQDVQILVPFDNEVAAVYLADTPDVVATVTIFRAEDAEDRKGSRSCWSANPYLPRCAAPGRGRGIRCSVVTLFMGRRAASTGRPTQWPARCPPSMAPRSR